MSNACACRMVRLLEQNMPTKRFKRFSGQVFLNRDSVQTLHHIFNAEVSILRRCLNRGSVR